MPTSRPAAGTFAANLNASHPIVANALGLWVVDADASVPDLVAVQADMVKNGVAAVYATTGNLGGHFNPGSSVAPSNIECSLATGFTSFPLVLGAVFARTGAKSPSSGIECIVGVGQEGGTYNGFCCIVIDDGTLTGGANGRIMGRLRTTSSGTVAEISTGIDYVDGDLNAVVLIAYDDSGRKGAMFLNGSKVFDTTTANDAFLGTDNLSNVAALILRRGILDVGVHLGSTSLEVALAFASGTKLTDQDYVDWTADPWSITGAGVMTSDYYIGADVTPGNWTTSTGSGTLTSMVSETTRDDTQYIQSAVNPSADLVELEWANVQIPSVNTDHTVSYVLKGDASCQALVALLAGDATTVTAWVHTALPPTFQRFDQELSTAAADAWSAGGYAGSHLTVTAG